MSRTKAKSSNPVGKSSAGGETLTRADALNYLKRFPSQGRLAVAANVALVLAGNSLVLWLLLSGRFRAAHLIALVMVEAVLLVTVAWIQHRLIPKRDWLEQPKPWRERLGVLLFLAVWLGGAYGITLLLIGGYGDVLALRSRETWINAGLHWPLAATLAFALFHAFSDSAHYRRHGGPFHSSVSHDAMARFLTLILGGIPFAMPFFAVAIGGFKGVEFVARKARVSPEQSIGAGIAILAVAMGSFWIVTLLIESEVTGWAIGFVFAKLISEVLIACIPLVMAKVASEGP